MAGYRIDTLGRRFLEFRSGRNSAVTRVGYSLLGAYRSSARAKGKNVQLPALHPQALAPHLDSAIDFEIPPIARCTSCHEFDCDGCTQPLAHVGLPWEHDRGSWLSRLWATARRSLAAATDSCLDSDSPRPLRALSFALLAELFASASLVAACMLLALLAFPHIMVELLGQASSLALLAALGGGLAVFLVLVHALWGFGLELGLAMVGAGFRPQRGLAFAFYACGWDLFTSPIGLVSAIARAGFKGGFAAVREATRVPRDAVLHYVTVCRGASTAHGNFVALFSFLLPVGVTLLLAGWAAVLFVFEALGPLAS